MAELNSFVCLQSTVQYRTVYMAMCSQTHHDADDVLNTLAADIVPGVNDMSLKMSRMTDNFGIFLVLCGVQYFLDAMENLGRFYNMPEDTARNLADPQH